MVMTDLFNGWKPLTIFTKSTIVSDVQWSPEFASETFCAYAKNQLLYFIFHRFCPDYR